MTKYKVKSRSNDIEKIEVARENLKSVILLDGRRRGKCSEFERYYDTLKEAQWYIANKPNQFGDLLT